MRVVAQTLWHLAGRLSRLSSAVRFTEKQMIGVPKEHQARSAWRSPSIQRKTRAASLATTTLARSGTVWTGDIFLALRIADTIEAGQTFIIVQNTMLV